MVEETNGAADLRRAHDRLRQRHHELAQAVERERQESAKDIQLRQERERRAVAALQRQAAEVMAALTALDRVLAQADSGNDITVEMPDGEVFAIEVKVPAAATQDGSPTSTSRAIERLLASEPRPFETAEIVMRVNEFGADAKPATTRSILAKMHKAGRVDQVKRGLYQAKSGGAPEAGPGGGAPSGGRYYPTETAVQHVLPDVAELSAALRHVNFERLTLPMPDMASLPHVEAIHKLVDGISGSHGLRVHFVENAALGETCSNLPLLLEAKCAAREEIKE